MNRGLIMLSALPNMRITYIQIFNIEYLGIQQNIGYDAKVSDFNT